MKTKPVNINALIPSGMRPRKFHAWIFLFLLVPAFMASADPTPLYPAPATYPWTDDTTGTFPEPSGAYYDWTKTGEPERPWIHQYDQTLVMKVLNATKLPDGGTKVYLTFEQTLEVLRKLDVITCGVPKIMYVAGWQHNGLDSMAPDWTVVNPRLKRPQDATALDSLKWLMNEGFKYHTIVSVHIDMISSTPDSPLFDSYLKNNIVAKEKDGTLRKSEIYGPWLLSDEPYCICYDKDGNVIKHISPGPWTGPDTQSYYISHAQEWKTGFAQRRINGLLAMLPIQRAGTIHIDAFHTVSPLYRNDPLSPYLGNTVADESAAQRKIIRYFRDLGVDATCEGMSFLRPDPFIGLEPMSWAPDLQTVGTTPKLWCSTPMRAEPEIRANPKTLPGLLDKFCLNVAPVMWSNHWRQPDDRNQPQAADWARVQQGSDICIPMLWKKEKTLLAYSRAGYAAKTWNLPKEWKTVTSVRLTRILPDGSKTEDAGTAIINDGALSLSLKPGEAVMITEPSNTTFE